MAIKYLKKSPKTPSTDDSKTNEIVKGLLKEIEISKERIEQIDRELDQKTKDDIQFSHERVKKFAEAQLKNYGQDFEVELSPGLYAGQKLIPVNTAGCYIPGGRSVSYTHLTLPTMYTV